MCERRCVHRRKCVGVSVCRCEGVCGCEGVCERGCVYRGEWVCSVRVCVV